MICYVQNMSNQQRLMFGCDISISSCIIRCVYAGTFNVPEKAMWNRVTVMNKDSNIYGAWRQKTTFHQFFLSTDDHVFNGWKGWSIKWICRSYDLKPSTVAFEYWKLS